MSGVLIGDGTSLSAGGFSFTPGSGVGTGVGTALSCHSVNKP